MSGAEVETDASVALAVDKTALTKVFAYVADKMGVAVSDGVELNASGVTAVYEFARRHNVLVRPLLLKERLWWQKDCGPLIAFLGEGKQPVALLPVTGGGYWMYDPTTEKKQKMTQDLALGLDDKVFMLHGRLTDGPQTPRGFFWFSFSRLGLDGVSVAVTGLMAMALAGVWPVLGARLFSTDVSLVPIVVTLLLAGLSAGLLGMVSHITQLRLFARARHGATTAFWDRIVRLPVAFIREDRAESLGQVANSLSAFFACVQTVVREGWYVLPALANGVVLCGVGLKLAWCVTSALWVGVLMSVYLTGRICRLEPLRFDVAVERKIARFANLKHVVSDMMPLLGVGGFVVGFDSEGGITSGQMIAASVCVMGMVMAMRSFSNMLNAWVMRKPQEERMTPVLAQPTEGFVLSQGKNRVNVPCDKVLDGAISVRNVTFRYGEHA